jgi:hypothetical protein
MQNFYLPEGMRPASLAERKEFYTKEFDLSKVAEWLSFRWGKTKFAVIIGRHTKIYPVAYRNDADTTILLDDYDSWRICGGRFWSFCLKRFTMTAIYTPKTTKKLGKS